MPGIDDVEQARPDNPTDHAPQRYRHNVVFGEATLDGEARCQPDPGEHANGGKKAVPGDHERSKPKQDRVDIDLDHRDDLGKPATLCQLAVQDGIGRIDRATA